MLHARIRFPFALFLAVLLLAAFAWPVEAKGQAKPVAPSPATAATQAPATPLIVAEGQDAEQTRRDLDTLLRRYPPSLGRVLKLDPALLANPAYLAPYPGVAAFLGQHPEVARNPAFFLANVEMGQPQLVTSGRTGQSLLIARGAMTFLIFLVVTAALLWLIKTLMDHRRWQRLSRAQAEIHGKLLDRFSASEDLLAFIQTPAGRRFLESAPLAPDVWASGVATPNRRILWAVEAGLVLAAGGIGLLLVSGRGHGDVWQSLFVLGVLFVSLGVGFVLAAIASYVLSKRLGVLDRARAANGDHPAAPGV